MSSHRERLEKMSPERRKAFELLAKKQAEEAAKAKAKASEQAEKDAPKKEAPKVVEDRWFNLGTGVFPDKSDVRELYDIVTTQLNASEFGRHSVFLNWGYVANHEPSFSQVVLPEIHLNKNPTRLVLEVIADTPVTTEDTVLDVACGRGGTVSVFRDFFHAGKVTGLDLSPEAVAFCRKRHTYPNTEFVVGDSENLPFPAETKTIVTNLESSHCYPNIRNFYSEVFRVLKPGGHFCYTDMLHAARIPELERFMREIGFEVVRKRDITANVLLSCDDIAKRHSSIFEGNNAEVYGNFLAVPGSRIYNEMKSGVQQYVIYKLRKPLGAKNPTGNGNGGKDAPGGGDKPEGGAAQEGPRGPNTSRSAFIDDFFNHAFGAQRVTPPKVHTSPEPVAPAAPERKKAETTAANEPPKPPQPKPPQQKPPADKGPQQKANGGGGGHVDLPPIVMMKRGGNRPPLFLVAPIFGSAFPYHWLALHMHAEQPVFGLQSPTFSGKPEKAESIPSLAREYITQIKKVVTGGTCPDGPYHVAGYSFGGWVAFEMARQLRKAGEEVAFVGIIGTPPPMSLLSPFHAKAMDYMAELVEAQIKLQRDTSLTDEERLKQAQQNGAARDQGTILQQVAAQNTSSSLRYAPTPIEQELSLFVTMDILMQSPTDHTLGWGMLTTREIDVSIHDGNHLNCFAEPHVADLAKKLERKLSSVRYSRS